MYIFIRKQTLLRTTLTKLYNNLSSDFKNSEIKIEEIESKFATLVRIYSNLNLIDIEILQLSSVKEEDVGKYAKKFLIIEEYSQKFNIISTGVKYFSQISNSQQSIQALSAEKSKLKLPKIELIKFGGEVKEWLFLSELV